MSSFFDKLVQSKEEEMTDESPLELEPELTSSKTKGQKKIKVNLPEEDSAKVQGLADQELEGQLTLDVYDKGDEIVIKSTIAGVKPEDLDVDISNDMITIRGKRMDEQEEEEKNYYYRECYWGAFSRSVVLPYEIDAEKSNASLKNGVLTINLPKLKKTANKKIAVKEES